MEDCPSYTEMVERTVRALKGRIPDAEWGWIACAAGLTSGGVGHWPDADDPYDKGSACRNCGYQGVQ